jgi:integrase
MKPTPGIIIRHSRRCPSLKGGKCDAASRRAGACKPTYRAWVFDKSVGGKIYRSFPTLTAAKAWRADALAALNKGRSVAPSKRTLREAAEAFLAGAKAEPPLVLNRSGRPYKPSVLRGYEADLRRYVLDDLGARRLSEIRRGELQALVDRLVGKGLSGSKVRNVIVALRVVFRFAIERDDTLEQNPTAGLRLPSGAKPRERAASPAEAAELLAALPDDLRALYATAAYAGLRRGELRALRWSDVDLAGGVITVTRSWDDKAGAVEPKSEKGKRTVPIVAVLRDELVEHKARTGRDGSDFVFGPAPDRPFTPSHVRRLAARAWAAENARRAQKAEEQGAKPRLLEPIGAHELRHTFVSLMFDAGLPLERIGDYVGHASTYMVDRYRHLLAGHEAEAARKFDEYLERANTAARVDALESR